MPESPPPTSAPLQTFSIFTSLPPEIQNKIFQHAIASYTMRVLELSTDTPSTTCTPDNDVIPVTYSFTSSKPIPPLLHACTRSRELAQLRWKLGFPSKMRIVKYADKMGMGLELQEEWGSRDGNYDEMMMALEESFVEIPRVWIDFEADLLILPTPYSLSGPLHLATFEDFQREIRAEERARVKNLAFLREDSEARTFLGMDNAREDEKAALIVRGLRRVFPGLKWVVVVLWTEYPRHLPASEALHRFAEYELEPPIAGLINGMKEIYNKEMGNGVVKVETMYLGLQSGPSL